MQDLFQPNVCTVQEEEEEEEVQEEEEKWDEEGRGRVGEEEGR